MANVFKRGGSSSHKNRRGEPVLLSRGTCKSVTETAPPRLKVSEPYNY